MKFEQDSIFFEWFKYLSYLKKSLSKLTSFHLPIIDDSPAAAPEAVCMHVLCFQGLLLVLNWGARRWRSIWKVSAMTGVMPMHKATGKTNCNSLLSNKPWGALSGRDIQILIDVPCHKMVHISKVRIFGGDWIKKGGTLHGLRIYRETNPLQATWIDNCTILEMCNVIMYCKNVLYSISYGKK